jgi:haloalkane dehalogenase
MQCVRTPEECFEKLHEYPFEPHYVEIPDLDGGTLRVHYVDEGPRDGAPIVFIHGNPTWSYAWRNVVPVVAAAGYRAIAVDLVGLGRSDKPTEMSDYTIARHVEWMRSALIDVMGLDGITLVLQDWGGIIGLRVLAAHPDKIARVCLANTGMFLRDPEKPIEPHELEPSGPFAAFQKMVRETPDWQHWENLRMLTLSDTPDEVIAGYRAPYPEPRFLTGNRQFTQMLATTADNPQLPDNWAAWQVIQRFERPFVTIFTAQDQLSAQGYKPFVEHVPGAQGQPHKILEGGSHFFQEDVVDEWNEALVAWLRTTDV